MIFSTAKEDVEEKSEKPHEMQKKRCQGQYLPRRTKQSYLFKGGYSWVLCSEHE